MYHQSTAILIAKWVRVGFVLCAHCFVYLKHNKGGIGARDVLPKILLSALLALFGILIMASTFFHWLRTPAAREYFFSMFTITLVLDRSAHGWFHRHPFLGTRSCLPATSETLRLTFTHRSFRSPTGACPSLPSRT